MRTILRWFQNILGVKGDDRFNSEWSNLAVIRVFIMMSQYAIRGIIQRPFIGSVKGLPLIGKGAVIHHGNYLHVGKGFLAEPFCEIQSISRRGIVFGDRVSIGRFAMIRPTNFYGRELGEGLKVGNNSNIGSYCYIGCSGYIEIGNNVMISPHVGIYAENHKFSNIEMVMKEQGIERESVIIEDDCWIASHSVILAGVRIGKGSVITAGSVVTKSVLPYSIVAGVPAKFIRSRKEEII